MSRPDRPADASSRFGKLLGRGLSISAGSFLVVQVLLLVQTVVVARLLSPTEIGLFAAGTVLSVFLIQLSEGGLRSALIQREHDLQEAANTVFWVTAAVGALLSLLSLAAAPLVARVFGEPTAGVIAAVTAATLFVHSLKNVPDGLLQRRLDFRRQTILDPAVALVNTVTAIAFAASGWGVWSLVIANYASLVVWVGIGWVLAGWRPTGLPGYRIWREMAVFGLPLILDGLSIRIRDLVETTVVGQRLDTAALGNYRYGRRIALLPGNAIVDICSYLLFPAFSRMAVDPDRLRRAFLRVLELMWFAVIPVAGLMAALGEPVVTLILGERWREAGILMAAMAGFGLAEALSSVSGEAMKGAGRSDMLKWIALITVVLGTGLLFLLVPYGLVGVGLAVSVTSLVVGITQLEMARRIVGLHHRDLVRPLLPPLGCGLVTMGAVAVLEHAVVHSDRLGLAAGLPLLVLESLLYCVIYLVAMRWCSPSVVQELIRRLRSRRGASPSADG